MGPSTGAGTSCNDTNGNNLSTVLNIVDNTAGPHNLTLCGNNTYTQGILTLQNANFDDLTIIGQVGFDPIVAPSGNGDVFRLRSDNITLEDFEIQGGQNAVQIFADGTNANLIDLVISGTSNDSILVQTSGVTIDGVSITGDAASNDGIQTAAGVTTNLTIVDTTINDTQNDGIQLLDGPATLTRVTVNNAGADGIQISANADDVTITDLTIDTTGGDCINAVGDDLDLSVSGLSTNALIDCGSRGLDLNINGGLGSGVANISNVTVTDPGAIGALLRNISSGTIDNISVSTTSAVLFQGMLIRDVAPATPTLTNFSVSGPFDYGIQIRNGDDTVFGGTNSIAGATIAGLYMTNGAQRNILSGFTISSNAVGVLISAPDNSDFTDFIIENNTDDGVRFINNSNNHQFFNATIRNNGGDGVDIQAGNGNDILSGSEIYGNSESGIEISGTSNNTIIQDSEIYSNTGSGLLVTSSGAGNTVEGNLFLGNGNPGVSLSGGTTSFYENCLRNSTNISDATGTTTYVNTTPNPDRGNFWGGFDNPIGVGTLGNGFSEDNSSCTDINFEDNSDDDICEEDYAIPGGGGGIDTEPLQICDTWFSTTPSFQKIVLTYSDPVNGNIDDDPSNNPKAIPNAVMRYVLTTTNSAISNRTGAVENATITDDFTTEIDAGRLLWETESMVLTSPDSVSSGDTTPDDATNADAGEFDTSSPEPDLYELSARCGDLNVNETCTLTFELELQ